MGHPTIYPTGTTIFNPTKAYNGYTIFQAADYGALLIDMNGKEVRLWKDLQGFPNKIFPGGYILGSKGERSGEHGMQDQIDLVQLDWDGNEVWKFDKFEYIQDPGTAPRWMARQHHDFQRTGSPTGYYAPGLEPMTHSGNTLLLCHKNIVNKDISDKLLLDDVFVEVDWEGNILWQWSANEHFHELGFSEDAKNVLFRDPNMRKAGGGMGDWLHINSMSTIGPNKWYDEGDIRFHPDNIIWDSREANIIAITSKKTGEIVWKIGPNYDEPETRHLGWIIGVHHAHIIPKGLPGAGNILLFDNGGWAGYGAPNPSSVYGAKNAWRDYSRILEINPVTLEIEWQYTAEEAGFSMPYDSSRFYSPYISSAQRLPNGNTLIDQGSDGRIFEITRDYEIVWEYISPYQRNTAKTNNMVYRAYRIPYSWVPQASQPEEKEILALDVNAFRLPNAAPKGCDSIVQIEGVIKNEFNENALCIATVHLDQSRPKLFRVNESIFTKINDKLLFDLIREKNKFSVVFFGAERCPNCKITVPLIEKIMKPYTLDKKANLYYIDVDLNQIVVNQYNIRSIPSMMIFKSGEEISRKVGIFGLKETEDYIQEIISEYQR